MPSLFDNDGGSRGGRADALSAAEHTVKGEVLRVVFASQDGTYVVIRLRDSHGDDQTLVGPMTGLMEGQDIEAKGHWETHSEHGRQLRVRTFKAVLPSSEEGIRRYLASGLIHGIGPKLATRIVDRFGVDTLDVLDRSSSRLAEVPGIGPKRIEDIRRAWREHEAQRDILVFLQGLGLTPGLCAKILDRYGAGAAEVVRRNPYRLAADVRGVGFLSADRIARRLGVEPTDLIRLEAGLLYVLEQLAGKGNVCYPRDALIAEAARILDVDAPHAERGLRQARKAGRVQCERADDPEQTPYVYDRRLHVAETGVAEALRILLAGRSRDGRVPDELLARECEGLNSEQRQAVHAAFEHRVSVITGGPGVGKTTVVGRVVAVARALRLRVELAAPTGRAAKRMGEAANKDAKTIHRLLRWDPATRSFVHGPDRPLKADVLIVDEASMLDVSLANSLLRAVPDGCRLVLVGDRDQLPSVGPGTVLHDIVASRCVPYTHLTRIYRQGEYSRIVTNAHMVNRGQVPDTRPVPRSVKADFYWIERGDPEQVADLIGRLVAERIPKRFGANPMRDIQVLSPMHRGNCGAQALNVLLQQRLNPGGHKPEFRFGERRFRSGDRVMQTVNNYDKGVFNGELGRLISIDARQKQFVIRFDAGDIEYEWHEAEQILHAYAVTVHKSQGSEFPVVVMPLLTQHYVMLQRNLLYTGMTRARSLLVLVGTHRALGLAVKNNEPTLRHTRLAARIAGRHHTAMML